MSKPFNLEDTIRIHDVAVDTWLGGLHVDYNYVDQAGGTPVKKNNFPILRRMVTPQREFAGVIDLLLEMGWLSNTSPAVMPSNYDLWEILPLPILTLARGEPELDSELQGPAKTLMTKEFDPVTGNFKYHRWPTRWQTEYTVTLWAQKRYSDVYMREWLMSQFGFNPGTSYREMLLPVVHGPPWGAMKQSFKMTGSQDLSELEGDGTRYIRVQFTFRLRTLFMFNPVIPPGGSSAGTPQLNAIGVNAGLVDSPPFGDTSLATTQDENGIDQTAVQTANLFGVSDDMIRSGWPLTGTATVARAQQQPGGRFGQAPVDGLAITVAGANDSAAIVGRQLVVDSNGNCIVSLSFKYISNGPVTLEMVSQDPTSGVQNLAFELTLPAAPQWTRVHVFALCPKSIFVWSIAGIASNPVYGVTLADVDARHIFTQTATPPDLTVNTGTEWQYLWYNLPPGPALVSALLLSNTGMADTFSVDNDVTSPTATNTQSLSAAVNHGLVALTQPRGSSLRLRVPTTVTLATPSLQVYAGSYNGHDLPQT